MSLMLSFIHLHCFEKEQPLCSSSFIVGPSSCYGMDGSDSVKCHDVTFYFKTYKSKKQGDATTVQEGQFAEFLFRPICYS